MRWYKDLYLGEVAGKKHYKLLLRINKRRLTNAYVITLPSNPQNVFDIYPYNELLQKHYNNSDIFIIGLAYGRDEAYELCKNIIWEIYKTTGGFNAYEYVKSREEGVSS